MTDSRAEILAKLGVGQLVDVTMPEAVLPAFAKNVNNLTLRLKQKLEAVHASVDIVNSSGQSGHSMIEFLQAHNSPLEVGVVPLTDVADLSLNHGLKFYSCDDFASCTTVLTRAAYGIAETGTVVLPSSIQRPTLANFLPDNCIVLLDEQNIVPYIEDALLKVRNSDSGMPRALNLISGPSKTADIEQTLVYGAHGPIQLHVIIRRHS